MSLSSGPPEKGLRRTDPGLLTLRLQDRLETYQEELRQGRGKINSSLLSILEKYLKKENAGPLNKQPGCKWIPGASRLKWRWSMDALQQLDCTDVNTCLRLLNDLQALPGNDAGRLRVIVVEALGSMGASAPIEPLVFALADPYWDVRAAAAQALGNMGVNTPIGFLTSMLKQEKDESVREAIIHALGCQGKRMPAATLVEILRFDKGWMSRQSAARALGELGADAPLKWLVYALRRDEDESVRAAAARSLGQTGRQQVKKFLHDALLDLEEEVRVEARNAIDHLEGIDPWKEHREIAALVSETSQGLLEDVDFSTDSGPDTGPELTPLSIEKTEDLLLSQEVVHQASMRASPIWGASWNERIVYLLTSFLKDRKGQASQPRMLQTVEGSVLLLTCFYEYSSKLSEELLPAFQQMTTIQSIDDALHQHNGGVGQAVEEAFKIWGERTWMDWLIVSFMLSHQSSRRKQEKTPLRVIVSGVSSSAIRRDDPFVMDQIISAWIDTVREPTICQRPQDLIEVKMWYQSAPGFRVDALY